MEKVVKFVLDTKVEASPISEQKQRSAAETLDQIKKNREVMESAKEKRTPR